MDKDNMIDQRKMMQKIVLQFATQMQWIEHEDPYLLETYVEKLDKEILRRKNEESTKARRKSRRSVCLRRAPSCSSSDDGDGDDDDIENYKDSPFHGDDGDDNGDYDGDDGAGGDDDGGSYVGGGGGGSENDVDNDDLQGASYVQHSSEYETSDNNRKKSVIMVISTEEVYPNCEDKLNQSSDDEDDFDAFVTKVKSWRKSTNIILSSDEEDRPDDMNSFIDDSELQMTTKNMWQKHRNADVIDLASDSDESPDESLKGRPTVLKKPSARSFYTPIRTPSKQMNYTPGILGSVRVPKTPHGSASYKREYKKLRNETATDLFNLFNETVFDNQLPKDLKIVFNKRMTKTAGFCYYYYNRLTKVRSSQIEIAEKVCDTIERLRDTIIHEMCHAAAWIVNGLKCGHGSHWKYWANKAHKAHPDLPPISVCHQFDIECKYNFKCINPYCGRSYGRHSKSLKKCPECLGSLQILGKDGVTPLKHKEANKFALYVKKEYQGTKQGNPQMNHAEIMKLLGRNFSQLST